MFIIAESNQLYLGDMLFYLVSISDHGRPRLALRLEASDPNDAKAG